MPQKGFRSARRGPLDRGAEIVVEAIGAVSLAAE